MKTARRRVLTVMALVGALSMTVGVASAQEKAPAAPANTQGEGAELAKKLANPISNLVSVPFQFNWEQNVGPQKDTRFILNVQPVMPFSLSKDLNLIARAIGRRKPALIWTSR